MSKRQKSETSDLIATYLPNVIANLVMQLLEFPVGAMLICKDFNEQRGVEGEEISVMRKYKEQRFAEIAAVHNQIYTIVTLQQIDKGEWIRDDVSTIRVYLMDEK